MNKSNFSFLLLCLFPFLSVAQDADILKPVYQLFDGMRAGDSTAVRDAFMPAAIMETISTDKAGNVIVKQGELSDFVTAVGTPHDAQWDEKIWSYKVRKDGNLATVWTDYTFYLGEKLSHCGINSFTLVKQAEDWKIKHLIDTRRRENCQTTTTDPRDQTINKLMDDWHHAAATGDEVVFFNTLGPESIYIGTDASERWTKTEFESFARKYFERDTAWAFQPLERKIYYSKKGAVAWFNETLDTWMGVCRGSGILEKDNNDQWILQHYHLAIAVPNEKVKGYLKLLEEE